MLNSYPRHHQITVTLHWATFFAIFSALSAVLLRELVEQDDLRLLLLTIHRSLGICILVLVIARVLLRYFYYFSDVTSDLPKTLRRIANAAHITIYTFLFLVPITGWLFTSTAGKPLTFFGLFHIPALLQKNRETAETFGEIHEVMAWLFIFILTTHIAAALWHHYVRKDNVLRSILPRWLTKK